MTMNDAPRYALGYADVEHDRLIRQARRFGGLTEAFLRTAGIGEGLRVLDLGSGIGDVAMLVADIVGPCGQVVGVERDARSVERARRRAREAGYTNVTFRDVDVAAFEDCASEDCALFDAVVGRFILQFIPEPATIVRSVLKLLRPRGIIGFQEVAWAPALAANSHLALWSACAATAHDAIAAGGANTNIGLGLNRILVEAGIPAPCLKVEMQLGTSPELVLWAYDLLTSVRAHAQIDRTADALGNLATLADRLQAEVADARAAVTSIAVVSAWSRIG